MISVYFCSGEGRRSKGLGSRLGTDELRLQELKEGSSFLENPQYDMPETQHNAQVLIFC